MIKALMVDVDGVLVEGRPEDGKDWQTSLEDDLAISSEVLNREFFTPYWEEIIVGRAALMHHLVPVLQKIAPHVVAEQFVTYWFEHDSRVFTPMLQELSSIRSTGVRIYLMTNQEHMRAAYLMEDLGLDRHVDGIFYSARMGVKKPAMEFFTHVRATVGLRGEELLLIDDSQDNIEAALKAGWQALHWTRHSDPAVLRRLCSLQTGTASGWHEPDHS